MFRVTVEQVTPKEPDQNGYKREDAREVYQQELEALDVSALARFLNEPQPPLYPGRMIPLEKS